MTPTMRTVFRWGLLLVTLGFIGWSFASQWDAMVLAVDQVEVRWGWILAASLMVLSTYALLIQGWRLLLAGWGTTIPFPNATRIWTIANLGRWLPGKVWSIGALGVLAADEGVSGLAAVGAAILGTTLNIGAGFAVMVLTGAEGLDVIAPGLRTTTMVLAAAFVAGVVALPWFLPAILDRLARWRGLTMPPQRLSARTLWLAAGINMLSWVGYGVAFALFAHGVTPHMAGNPVLFIAVFAASYLIGFLALFSPGGLGVREYALVALLVGLGAAGHGDALVLSATSRVWFTVLEIVPGLISLRWLPPSRRASLRSTT